MITQQTILTTFSRRVADLMNARKYTVKQLAVLCEVSDQSVRVWLNGQAIPSTPQLARLASNLGCEVHELFEPEPTEHGLTMTLGDISAVAGYTIGELNDCLNAVCGTLTALDVARQLSAEQAIALLAMCLVDRVAEHDDAHSNKIKAEIKAITKYL